VQLRLGGDGCRAATDEGQKGIRTRRRVRDQGPTEVRVSGDPRWHVQVHPHRAVEARYVVVNEGQEGTVDVRKLDTVTDDVTVDGDRREPLRRSRDRGRLVRAGQERNEPFPRRRY